MTMNSTGGCEYQLRFQPALPTLKCLQANLSSTANQFTSGDFSGRNGVYVLGFLTSRRTCPFLSRIFFCFDSKLNAAELGSMQPCLGSTPTHSSSGMSSDSNRYCRHNHTFFFSRELTGDTSFFCCVARRNW